MSRILLVDDQTESLRRLRHLLESRGHEVEVARHGAEALVKARRSGPDLIVSELLMPVMDGFTLLRHCKIDQQLQGIPVAIHTATGSAAQDEQLVLELGADAFISKSADPADFLDRVDQLVDARRRGDQSPARRQAGAAGSLDGSCDAARVRRLEEKILELQQANRELATRGNRLSAILEAEPECVKLLAADGALLEMNPAGLRMLEAESIQQVANHCVYPIVDQEHRAAFRALTRKVFSGGTGTLEFRITGLKGGRRWLETHATPLLDEQGGVTALLGITRDITERKQTEEALRESEARFRTVLETVPLIGLMLDREGRITLCSDHLLELTGWTRAEVIGGNWFELFLPPEAREQVLTKVFHQAVQDGELATRYENEIVTRQGERRLIAWSNSIVRDQTGATIGVTSLGEDITERRAGEAALRESEDRFRRVFQEGPMGITMASLTDRRFLSVNRAICDMLGYTEAELMGLTFAEITHPDHLDEDFRAVAELGTGQIQKHETEKRYLKKNGEIIWATRALTKIDGSGDRASYALAMIQDITERKRAAAAVQASQRMLQLILDNIPQGVFWKDRESRYLGCNAVVARTFGFADAAQTLGKTDAEFGPLTAEQAECFLRKDREVMESGESQLGIIEQSTFADGSTRWLETNKIPLLDPAGGVQGVLGTWQDITPRKQAEAERRQLEAQLQQSQKMEAVGTLAGGIAHDFNNMLGAIIGNAELAALDLDPAAAAREHVEEICRAGLRAKALVRQILAFSRHEPSEKRIVDLRATIEEAERLLRATLPAGVELATHYAADLLTVLADPVQIHQVLLNLGTNAWHAMGGQPGRITLRLEGIHSATDRTRFPADLPPGHYLRLTFSDSGKGMRRDTLERIFDPFFTTKGVGQGTGLGLSIVHGIIKEHRGAILVSSELNKGTTFEIFLPADGGPTAAAGPSAVRVSSGPIGQGRRVLYVDDEAPLVSLATRILQRQGFDVSGFTRPLEAMAALRNDPGGFDLVMTDYNMPGASGLVVAREARRLRPDLPVMLISGLVTEEIRIEAGAAGVLRLLHKPWKLEEFTRAVRHLIQPGPPPS